MRNTACWWHIFLRAALWIFVMSRSLSLTRCCSGAPQKLARSPTLRVWGSVWSCWRWTAQKCWFVRQWKLLVASSRAFVSCFSAFQISLLDAIGCFWQLQFLPPHQRARISTLHNEAWDRDCESVNPWYVGQRLVAFSSGSFSLSKIQHGGNRHRGTKSGLRQVSFHFSLHSVGIQGNRRIFCSKKLLPMGHDNGFYGRNLPNFVLRRLPKNLPCHGISLWDIYQSLDLTCEGSLYPIETSNDFPLVLAD